MEQQGSASAKSDEYLWVGVKHDDFFDQDAEFIPKKERPLDEHMEDYEQLRKEQSVIKMRHASGVWLRLHDEAGQVPKEAFTFFLVGENHDFTFYSTDWMNRRVCST